MQHCQFVTERNLICGVGGEVPSVFGIENDSMRVTFWPEWKDKSFYALVNCCPFNLLLQDQSFFSYSLEVATLLSFSTL